MDDQPGTVAAPEARRQPPPARPEEPRGSRRLGVLLVAVWLVFLVQPLGDGIPAASSPAVQVLAVSGSVGFSIVYVVTMVVGFTASARLQGDGPPWIRSGAAVVAMAALAAVTIPALHTDALVFGTYISVAAIIHMHRWRARVVVGLVVAASLACYAFVPGERTHVSGTVQGLMLAVAASVLGMRARQRSLQLAAANERVTELAVAAERERMARDLHDILGHSLTVIVMKAELAGALARLHRPDAVDEIDDIERLARGALADVRATISGAKEVTVASELPQARAALEAADIQAHLPVSVDEIDPASSQVFGWVLREAVTNVVRHSRARNCWVETDPHTIRVIDDGDGLATDPAPDAGRGLAGLRRRVADAGGTLTLVSPAGPPDRAPDHGGFEVRADLPAVGS